MAFNIKNAKQINVRKSKLILDEDAALIGEENLTKLVNTRYGSGGLEGVAGYSKLNEVALADTPLSGFHFKKDFPSESYLFVHTKGHQIKRNNANIPNTGEFEESVFFADTSDSENIARFSEAPQGTMVYCNGKGDSIIWGGEETKIGAFFTSSEDIINKIVKPKDYTYEMRNISQSESITITDGDYGIIGSTKPLNKATFHILSGNEAESPVLYFYEWNGNIWGTLSITDETDGLKQTGSVAWASTKSTSKVKFLEGLILYWYKFKITDGEASIYHVTVSYSPQPIIDIWDGVYRQPIIFQENRAGVNKEYTLEINQPSEADYPYAANIGGLANTDHIIIMFDERMTALSFKLIADKNNQNASVMSIYYNNGEDWQSVGALQDLTLNDDGTKSLSVKGTVGWNAPDKSLEFSVTQFDTTGYAYKIVFSTTLSGTAEDIKLDTVTGIPAQQIIYPFKFPVMYKNYLMLCSYIYGQESNRIDFSSENTPDVWNGELSSMGGLQSLYVGGDTEIIAATQLYNRFGANIFATLIILKRKETYLLHGDTPEDFKIYPISLNIGCPAYDTLDTAEIGFDMGEEAGRNIALWLSYSGLILFDGATIFPIKGIDKFFDPANSDCINYDAIDKATGKFDSTYSEYNLLIPSGAGQTNNNKWLIFDLKKNRWYEKIPPKYPQRLFKVSDNNGVKYLYACMDDGYIRRIEHGTTWDGAEINQIIETGDFLPAENFWLQTQINYLKVVIKRLAEEGNLEITYYKDSSDTPEKLKTIAFNEGSNRIAWVVQALIEKKAVFHRLKFEGSTSNSPKGIQLLSWGYQWEKEKEDI